MFALEEIKLPTNPNERIALVEQESVAELLLGSGVTRGLGAGEQTQKALAATVRNFEHDGAIPELGLDRTQNVNVGRILDTPFGVARGQLKIVDDFVGGRGRVGLETCSRYDALVGAYFSKLLAVEDRRTFDNSKAGYLGRSHCR